MESLTASSRTELDLCHPASVLRHSGTSNASRRGFPAISFPSVVDRVLYTLIMCRHPQSKLGAAVGGGLTLAMLLTRLGSC